MPRLCQTDGLSEDQSEILKAVRQFVDEQIIPVAQELEHADEYPTEIIEGLKELGVFGLTIPEEFGGLGRVAADVRAGGRGDRARLDERVGRDQHPLHRGLHADAARHRGAEAEVPAADGDRRGARRVLDVRAGPGLRRRRRSRPRPRGDDGRVVLDHGQKMWLTNGATSTLVAVLTKTDEGAESVYKNMTTFLVEKEAGFGQTAQGITVPGKIDKMGYKGVETTELILEGHVIAAEQVLGGEPGKGFFQMMDGVEVGRVNVAARACGLAWRGLRARHRLRPAAQDLRQADRRAPGGAVPARGDGHQGRGRPHDDGQGRPVEGHRAAHGRRGRDGEDGRLASTPTRSSRTPSASTAATATPRSTRSNASCARSSSCSSAKAPPTSRR